MKRRIMICLAVSLLVFCVQANADLVVDLDAGDLALGDTRSWVNNGSVGGQFDLWPGDPNLVVEEIEGVKCVTFADNPDGGIPAHALVSDFATPAGITGNNPYTIAVLAYQPTIAWEECMINWARRGTSPRAAQFNYGESPVWGATTHWDTPDLGWNPFPPSGQWHHLTVTYTGGTDGVETVFVNGISNNSEVKTLDLWPDGVIYIGCSIESDDATRVLAYNGSLAYVKMFDRALSAAEIAGLAGKYIAGEVSPEAVTVGEDGTTADLTIQLTAGPFGPPTQDVSITLTPVGDTSEVKLGDAAPGDPATVVFPTASWDTPVTLTVSTVDDEEMELVEIYTFDVTLTSADTNYDGQIVLPPVLTVSIEDNEQTDNVVPEVYQDGFLLDSFDIARDYLAHGTDDTPWDGFVVGGSPVSDVQINASVATNGVLRLQSADASWAGNPANKGPYLYQLVEGDFIAEVYIAEYANSIEQQSGIAYNDCGIMVRVADIDDAGPGEDNIQCAYFPLYEVGDTLRWNDDGVRTDATDESRDGWLADRWLRVERRGNEFYCSHSPDGENWRPFALTGNPHTRDDMDLPVLQVGLMHATYTGNTGWAEFENFRIKTAVGRISGDATVLEIGETSDTIDVQLNRAPSTEITVQLTAAAIGDNPLSDANDIRINDSDPGKPALITFTPENWDQIRTVTVTAVDDTDEEGTQMLTILGDVISDPNTSDPNFVGGWLAADVVVTVLDNLPGFMVIETGDSTVVGENGGIDEFTVSLMVPPVGSVTVLLADSSDPLQVVISHAPLTFTADDYDQPRTVTVAAINDEAPEDDPHGTTIVLTASSGTDAGYDGLEATVEVSIAENDCGAWGTYWADFDGDCEVNLADLAELVDNWLACTIPNEPGCVDMR